MQAREQRLVTATPRCRTGGVLAGIVQHAVSYGRNCRIWAACLFLVRPGPQPQGRDTP